MKTKTDAGSEQTIEFTSIPAYGSYHNLKGLVRHVDAELVRLAVYIRVHGGWWTKPYFEAPATSIAPDGSFSLEITTGGNDEQATEIAAFLIPADYAPPVVRGDHELPAALLEKALAKAEITRTP